MLTPLTPTFSKRENRITATIVAYFERLSFYLMAEILRLLTEEPEIQLLKFQNQPKGEDTIPDALIKASFSYWIETKVKPNAITNKQILGHLMALDNEKNIDEQRLLILTPDNVTPIILKEISDKRIVWINFEGLVNTIKDILYNQDEWITTNRHIPTERERELLRELVNLLIHEKLIGTTEEQVIVVAARIALEEYKEMNAYMCQPNRTFQPATHLAFYNNNKIYKNIPNIEDIIDNVIFTEKAIMERKGLNDDSRKRLIELIDKIKHYREVRLNQENKVFLLSAPEDDKTLKLDCDIENDLKKESGRKVAFVQGQRYVPLSKFKLKPTPRTTSELLK